MTKPRIDYMPYWSENNKTPFVISLPWGFCKGFHSMVEAEKALMLILKTAYKEK